MLTKIKACCVFISMLTILSTSYACPQADSTSVPTFCSSFKSVAACHCTEVLPSFMCQDMAKLYKRMIGLYSTQENACRHQHDTSFQICMDDWDCYRFGGKDSDGKLCNGSGLKCE